MDELTPQGGTVPARRNTSSDETITAALAEHVRIQRGCELGAGRLRILSERLAVPTRQARETWLATWQCVADTAAAGDAENAAQALALAGTVLCVALDSIATGWLAEARAWLRAARAECDGFVGTTVVGLDEGSSFVNWDSPEFVGVPRWLADRGEFGAWALAIDRVESLRLLPGLMQAPPLARSRGVDFCLDVLALITEGASAGHFRALLEIPGGAGRLAGLSAALAVCFAPPPAGHEFRAVDLPGDAGQCETAGRLLRMADSAYGGCAHIKEFHQKHAAVWARPAPSATSPSPAAPGTSTEDGEKSATGPAAQGVAEEPTRITLATITPPAADRRRPAEVGVEERRPDGPGEPLDFWYGGARYRFESGIARLDSLLRVLWPGFRTQNAFATENVADDYRRLKGGESRAPLRRRMASDVRELNDWLSRTVAPGPWLAATQTVIRWTGPPRQPENNAIPRG